MHAYAHFLWKLPSQCLICHRWPSDRICFDCREHYAQVQPRCIKCALLLPPKCAIDSTADGAQICVNCLRQPLSDIDHCYAAISYRWPWQQCIDDFKFDAQTGRAHAIAEVILKNTCISRAIKTCNALVPMPLHPLRLAERGYNQSLLLAKALRHAVKKREKLHPQQAVLQHNWLQRVRNTPPQSRLSLTARLRNMHKAFAVTEKHVSVLQGKRVVLIDDVMTTGASAQAAARALHMAGAAHVCVVVFARTEKP